MSRIGSDTAFTDLTLKSRLVGKSDKCFETQVHFSGYAVSRPLTSCCSIIPCEIMPLTIGTQLGSHEITDLLGKGGMGEVYRARDTKLKREVAIKILPDEFSRNADRVARF